MSLISGVPVSAISSGRAMRARMRSESCEHVLGALRRLVLDEVRLVDDHAAEAEVAEPADVPVEHLVVDDDDVGEAVDRVAVAVDHGGGAVRRPEARLARPVGLDDVRHDDEQRVGVGGLRGEQRLRGLAEARLVGEQEGAVAGLRGRATSCAWWGISSRPPGVRSERRLGQRPCTPRRRAAVLERAEQRAEQLPVGQPARRGGALCSAAAKSGARNGLASWRETTDCGTTRRSVAADGGGGSARARPPRGPARRPAAISMSRLSDRAASETTASSASSARSEVSRAAVFARIVAMPSRRLSCSARWASVAGLVGLDAGALLAHQQGDDLELRAHRRRRRGRAGRLPRPRARRGRAPG